jgi:hypothetical protein
VLAARHASASFDNDVSPPAFSARGDRLPARDDDASAPFDAPTTQEAGKIVEPTTETDEDSEARSARNALAERLSRVRDASRAPTASPRDKGEETARLPGGKTARPVVPPVRGKAVPAGKAEAPRRGRLTGLTAKPAPGGDEGPTMVGPPSGEVPEGGRLGGILSFSRWGSRGAETETSAGGKQAMSGSGRLTALGAALRNDEAESAARDAPGVATDAAPDTEAQQDQNITGGLLGRKAERQTTPSFRTGLLLTVILLILLAAIAVWSALFLPDSPVARLFGDGEDVAANEPLDAPGPPEAITAPPAIGELTGADTLPTPPEEAASGETEATDEAAADGADLAAVAPVDADPEPAAPPPEAATASETTATEPAPLPPLPADDLPSLEETRAAYEEYGIWQRPPDRPDVAPLETSVDLTVAAADQAVSSIDAVSLPAPQVAPDETFPRIQPPPPFGEIPRTTADGLVEPTPDGVVTPDGVLVIAGSPPRTAIPRPREENLPAPAPSFSIEDAILGTFRPAQRPDDLGSVTAPPLPGATTDTARAGLEPQPNPVAAVTSVAAASLVPLDPDTTVEAPAPDLSDASRLAVARSILPATRPDDIDSIIATASARPGPEPPPTAVEPAAVAPAPSIPSNADVARAATQNNELRLRDINLIGVTGTPSDRRALIRLPSGRFVRVGVGDRLDGGRVAAIGETTLQYVRNGRTLTLDIPG